MVCIGAAMVVFMGAGAGVEGVLLGLMPFAFLFVTMQIRSTFLRKLVDTRILSALLMMATFVMLFVTSIAAVFGILDWWGVAPGLAGPLLVLLPITAHACVLYLLTAHWGDQLTAAARAHPSCTVCGYDLYGTPIRAGATCPECGHAIGTPNEVGAA